MSARLLEALDADSDAATRRLAAIALGELGAARPEAVPPETRSRLQAAGEASEDADLRRAAERALRRLAEGVRH